MTPEEIAKNFWEKSLENQRVFEYARGKGEFNASASRYYYALWLAFSAYFLKNGILAPEYVTRRRNGANVQEENKNYPGWPRLELHDAAGRELSAFPKNVTELMKAAYILRRRADYKEIDVEPWEFDHIIDEATGLFEMIGSDFNDDE